ncbi:DUF3515 family protein [Aeromicrobium sp. UC242_57]|uniref:DUF3515 family protein n=1 Tax=Aeromicrobium sp. UC242_57 TaxID=3374624 RepID=UPI00379ACEF3
MRARAPGRLLPDPARHRRRLQGDVRRCSRTLRGEDAIAVKDDNAVAWGAPAIVLRCGVERPADLTVTAECFPVEDVGWFVETIAGGYLFTTIGREFHVSVEVPDDYEPAADTLIELAETVKKHDPEVKPCV